MIIKNWQDSEPKVRKQAALEWTIITGNEENEKDSLTSHEYISRIWIQPGMVMEPDKNLKEEEIFYIVSGTGRALVQEKSYSLKDGDTVYIAAGETYLLLNEGLDPLELVAFGANVEKEAMKDKGIIVRNWRDAIPWLLVQVHGYGIDWRLMAKHRNEISSTHTSKVVMSTGKVDEVKDPEMDKRYECFRTINFFSYALLQPGKSYEPHGHTAEEVYYMIKGNGTIRAFMENNKQEDFSIRPGDVVLTPVGEKHQLINDGKEFIEFIAWGASRD